MSQWFELADHLGSTAVVANSSGGKTGELRCYAWGETRCEWGSLPTTYRYTGQRLEAGLGLYYYRARWYDPALGRFIQADTIVPDPLMYRNIDYTLAVLGGMGLGPGVPEGSGIWGRVWEQAVRNPELFVAVGMLGGS